MKTVTLDLGNADVCEAIEREVLAQKAHPLPDGFPVAEGTYARMSKDGGRVTYTPNQEKLLADKQWVKLPKDYLTSFFDGHPEIIQAGMDAWNNHKGEEISDFTHYVCANAAEIVDIFNNPYIGSCMSIHSSHEKLCDTHPAEAYDTNDFDVIVIEKLTLKVGRLVANRKIKEYVRLYLSECGGDLDEDELRELHKGIRRYVKQLGYVQDSDALEGCQIAKIEEKILGTTTYIVPYVDFRVNSTDDLVPYNLDGEFRLTKEEVTSQYSNLCLTNTTGIGLDVHTCNICSSNCIELLALADADAVCQSCYDDSHSALVGKGEYGNFGSDEYITYVEQTSEAVHSSYLDSYLDDNDLCLVDGEIVDIDDVVEIDGYMHLKKHLDEYTDSSGDTSYQTGRYIRSYMFESAHGNGYFEDEEMRDTADKESIESSNKETENEAA